MVLSYAEKKKKLQALRLIKFSHLYQNYASFQFVSHLCYQTKVLSSMPITYKVAKSLRQQIFTKRFISLVSQKKETRDEVQISLPKQRLGISFKR